MSNKEKKEITIFLSINSFFSTVGMIYFIVKKPTGLIGGILPAYFFAVIAAFFVIFFIHPKRDLFKEKLRLINWFMLIFTLSVIATIIYQILK